MKLRLPCRKHSLAHAGISTAGMKKCTLLFLIFLVVCSVRVVAQQRISGRVTSGDSTVSNATIQVKGAASGTQSDASGNFAISAPVGSTLVISHVGFVTQQVRAAGNGNVTVQLVASVVQSMDEVVVVGYGTQKRSDVTGSVTSVPKERLAQLPVTNVLQAIEGSVPGVNVTQNSSVPGASPGVVVRGVNSISASTAPFIVVDGIPFSTTGGSLNDINPSDIASIEILKDPSAVAIYGTRGANGVILVTTKRGKSGKAAITYNVYGGLEDFSHKVEPLNPAEYIQKYADWKAQAGSTDPSILPNAFERANYAAGTTTNWLDKVSQKGYIQNHTLSISGGSKDVRYYVSGDYLQQKGVVKGYQYHRASIRSNLDATITDYLTAGVNLFLTANNYDGGRANLTGSQVISPYGTYTNTDGAYTIYPMFGEILYISPLLGLTTTRNDRSKNVNASAYAELKPAFAKGLSYRINAAYSYVPTLFQSYIGRAANNLLGGAEIDNGETKNWVVENIVNYDKTWRKHHAGLTALYSIQETLFSSSGITASGFINDAVTFNNLSSAANASGVSNAYKTDLLSQMLRFNYSYDSRYLFTATARRDGFSAFGSATNKYGLFPSVAVGWNISNENFMKDVQFISTLKVRASYGLSGNQAISPNAATSTLSSVRLPINGLSNIGVIADVIGNTKLNWESTYGTNIGIDFSILKNRITGTIETYNTKTKDLLLYRALPTVSGYTKVLDNLGKVSNQGFELALKSQNVNGKNFRWETSINYATNKNKIIDLYGDKKDDIGNMLFIGKPIDIIYDYKLAGVWQVNENPSSVDPIAKPGDLKFVDLNGSKTITADDKTVIGQTRPKWTGGITNTFHYKSFHLNVFIQTAQGITRNNPLMDFRDLAGRQNLPGGVGYWTAANQSNTRPSLSYLNSRLYGYAQDASYTRIKDVTLSFTAPSMLLEKTKLGGLTLYVSGRNLITFTKWVGWDPEADYDRNPSAAVNGINSYPLVRSFVLGANITLR